MSHSSRKYLITRGTAAIAVSLLTLLSGVTAQAADNPLTPTPTHRKLPAGRYIVTLADAPTATYQGGVGGISRTAPAAGAKLDPHSANATRYRDFLHHRQDDAAASVGAKVRRRYNTVTNGFAADLTALQAARLSAQPGVLKVSPDARYEVADDSRATDFLGLSGRHGVWSALGGTAKAGRGVVVGDIDTGIWPESDSFAGSPLGGAPPTARDPYRPYLKGDVITMRKANGGTFTGSCQTGEEFGAGSCNTKLVGARYFADGWLAVVRPEERADYLSPRDIAGHGTHTASTAVGNANVHAVADGHDLGTVSGVAPGAVVAAYKALWTGKDGNSIGTTDDIVAAIDQAATDGVDVINFSAGNALETGINTPVQEAFRAAAAAGIFVSAAAGNTGPDTATLDNVSPWVTTVAASTLAPVEATVKLGDGQTFVGSSRTVTAPLGPDPLVRAEDVRGADADMSSARLCKTDTLDPAKTAGTIVMCDRGVNSRVSKSQEVERAGGAGMVLVNTTDLDTDADLHMVPTVHLNAPDATAVRVYAAKAGATATLLPGGSSGISYPQVAPFSSRGPSEQNKGALIKPDVTAPGVAVLAAVAPPGNFGRDFDFMSGTSMAAPQISGLAALYFGAHPTWSPMAVKSALMTTAVDTRTATGATVTDPFAQGSGEVDPAAMLDPGLVYDSSNTDWLAYEAGLGVGGEGVPPVDPSDLNYPSIATPQLVGSKTVTRTLTATRAGVYQASAQVPGIDVEVKPSTVRFTHAGQTAKVKITLTLTTGRSDHLVTGSLTWNSPGHSSVRSPIAVTPYPVLAPERVVGSGPEGSVSYQVTPGTGKLTLAGYGPVVGQKVKGEISATGEGLQMFAFTVPEGGRAGEFFLTTNTPEAQLILEIVTDPSTGQPSQVVGNFGELGHQVRVSVPDLPPGRYLALVVDIGDPPGTSSTGFALQSNVVGVGASFATSGTFSVSPQQPVTRPGVPLTVTGTWSGLGTDDPATAYVAYPNGAGTLVSIGG
ncbi:MULTISPECIES: S8 family peptidase [unclassified Streptomyces]|uniref:S8 family peptidase n=1 Tax=unclassified Streptomyces TaxID=2593676 RepID=UPI0036E71554